MKKGLILLLVFALLIPFAALGESHANQFADRATKQKMIEKIESCFAE